MENHDSAERYVVVTCPHCGGMVEILAKNCNIFRHAILKSTGTQVDPHTPKAECDRLRQEGLVWGCGKPFSLTGDSATAVHAVPCAYI